MLHRGEGGCDGTDVLLHRCLLAARPRSRLPPRRQSSRATTLCRGRSADSPSLGLHPRGHLTSSRPVFHARGAWQSALLSSTFSTEQ